MREITAEQIVLELLDAWLTKSYGNAEPVSHAESDSSRLESSDERAACHARRIRISREGE